MTQLCILNSNYVVINDRLARHYNLPEVFGNEFRPVKLPRVLNEVVFLLRQGCWR